VESKLPAPLRAGLRATRCAPAPTTCPEVGRACEAVLYPARRPRRPGPARPCPVLPGRHLVPPFL